MKFRFFCSGLFYLLIVFFSKGMSAEPVSEHGIGFSIDPKKVIFAVPAKNFTQLPERLGVWKVDGTTAFPSNGVHSVLELTSLPQAEKDAINARFASGSVPKTGRTILSTNQGIFVFDADIGTLIYKMNKPEIYRNPNKIPTTNDSFVKFGEFHRTLKSLVAGFNWSDSDIERHENGAYKMQISDDHKFPNHQKEPVLVQRSASVYRNLDGLRIVSADTFEIRLTRLITGEWREIIINWPKLEKVETTTLSYHSNDDLKNALSSKKLFWDHGNTIEPQEIKTLKFTGIRIAYFHSRNMGEIRPALMLDADMITATGTVDGVFYLPFSNDTRNPTNSAAK